MIARRNKNPVTTFIRQPEIVVSNNKPCPKITNKKPTILSINFTMPLIIVYPFTANGRYWYIPFISIV